jgi:hypothetical protein
VCLCISLSAPAAASSGAVCRSSCVLGCALSRECLAQNGTKVVCGSQEGVLDIYTWGQWGDISDRFPGHPSSIDSLVAVSEELILTASSDGLIRYRVCVSVCVCACTHVCMHVCMRIPLPLVCLFG